MSRTGYVCMREVRRTYSFKFGFGSWHLAFGNAWNGTSAWKGDETEVDKMV